MNSRSVSSSRAPLTAGRPRLIRAWQGPTGRRVGDAPEPEHEAADLAATLTPTGARHAGRCGLSDRGRFGCSCATSQRDHKRVVSRTKPQPHHRLWGRLAGWGVVSEHNELLRRWRRRRRSGGALERVGLEDHDQPRIHLRPGGGVVSEHDELLRRRLHVQRPAAGSMKTSGGALEWEQLVDHDEHPTPAARSLDLVGVSCPSTTSCFAVGDWSFDADINADSETWWSDTRSNCRSRRSLTSTRRREPHRESGSPDLSERYRHARIREGSRRSSRQMNLGVRSRALLFDARTITRRSCATEGFRSAPSSPRRAGTPIEVAAAWHRSAQSPASSVRSCASSHEEPLSMIEHFPYRPGNGIFRWRDHALTRKSPVAAPRGVNVCVAPPT